MQQGHSWRSATYRGSRMRSTLKLGVTSTTSAPSKRERRIQNPKVPHVRYVHNIGIGRENLDGHFVGEPAFGFDPLQVFPRYLFDPTASRYNRAFHLIKSGALAGREYLGQKIAGAPDLNGQCFDWRIWWPVASRNRRHCNWPSLVLKKKRAALSFCRAHAASYHPSHHPLSTSGRSVQRTHHSFTRTDMGCISAGRRSIGGSGGAQINHPGISCASLDQRQVAQVEIILPSVVAFPRPDPGGLPRY